MRRPILAVVTSVMRSSLSLPVWSKRTLEQLEKAWYLFFFQNEGVAEEWLRRDD